MWCVHILPMAFSFSRKYHLIFFNFEIDHFFPGFVVVLLSLLVTDMERSPWEKSYGKIKFPLRVLSSLGFSCDTVHPWWCFKFESSNKWFYVDSWSYLNGDVVSYCVIHTVSSIADILVSMECHCSRESGCKSCGWLPSMLWSDILSSFALPWVLESHPRSHGKTCIYLGCNNFCCFW